MTLLRFIHAADLHLDSPFRGLRAQAPEHVADALYKATFEAYDNIVDLCVSQKVDALLVAGDVYDSADRSLRAQRKFVDGLEKLHASGIRSFVCHGNHDPLDGWEARLALPPSCHRFGAAFEAVPAFESDPGRAVVHGISYPRQKVTSNLVRRLRSVDQGPFSIGLLHTNAVNDQGHAPYAPCSLEDLRSCGIDYWALGHVHTRQVLHEQAPAVVYPGNPQGRHAGEAGSRGVYQVEVNDDGHIDLQFRAVDKVRWEQLSIDIGALGTEQELIDALHDAMERVADNADGRSVIARATLMGMGEMHRFLRRPNVSTDLVEQINEAFAGRSPFIWLERTEERTRPPFDRKERLAGVDFLAEVLCAADRAKDQPARLRDGLVDLYGHHALRRRLTPLDDAELAGLIEEAELLAVTLLEERDEDKA